MNEGAIKTPSRATTSNPPIATKALTRVPSFRWPSAGPSGHDGRHAHSDAHLAKVQCRKRGIKTLVVRGAMRAGKAPGTIGQNAQALSIQPAMKILPGFRILRGSSACLICRITPSASPSSSCR